MTQNEKKIIGRRSRKKKYSKNFWSQNVDKKIISRNWRLKKQIESTKGDEKDKTITKNEKESRDRKKEHEKEKTGKKVGKTKKSTEKETTKTDKKSTKTNKGVTRNDRKEENKKEIKEEVFRYAEKKRIIASYHENVDFRRFWLFVGYLLTMKRLDTEYALITISFRFTKRQLDYFYQIYGDLKNIICKLYGMTLIEQNLGNKVDHVISFGKSYFDRLLIDNRSNELLGNILANEKSLDGFDKVFLRYSQGNVPCMLLGTKTYPMDYNSNHQLKENFGYLRYIDERS